MKLLASNTATGSLVTPLQVISYTQSTPFILMVNLRVSIGTQTFPIVGNGTYVISAYINGVLLSPTSSFNVPSGTTQTVAISRDIVLEENDVLTVSVTGQAGDTGAGVVTRIYDVTPVTVGESSGSGQTLVDHDYPTANAMTLIGGDGAPIVGACIYIYLASDFNAGNLAPEFIVARSATIEGGIWRNAVALNNGDYVAYFFKQSIMSPTSIAFTVNN